MNLPQETQRALDTVLAALKSQLGQNLHSCILYGSAVRGSFVPGVSDLNLMLVLEESTSEAHGVIAEILRGAGVEIEPFILRRRGIERSMRSFAIKFESIRRHYKVLHGADLLAGFKTNLDLHRFLTEQALRNLRLRMTHAFVIFGHQPKRYQNWLINTLPSLFVDLSEVLRCEAQELPDDYRERLPELEKTFAADVSVLRELTELKQTPREITVAEIKEIHAKTTRLVSAAIDWIEEKWPTRD